MCALLFQGSSSHLLWVSSNENAPKDLHLIFFFPIHFSISNAKLLMLATVWSDFSFFFLPKLRFWLGWGFTLKYQLVWVDDNYWELGGACPGFQLEFNRALLLTCALLSNSFLDALSLLFSLKKMNRMDLAGLMRKGIVGTHFFFWDEGVEACVAHMVCCPNLHLNRFWKRVTR